MRRTVCLALAGLVTQLAGFAHATEVPGVRVSETEPFTVRGFSFRPGERVKIVVRAGHRFETARTAAADGSFSAVLPGVKFDECRGYVVKAEGNLGSRASRKLRAAECGAPLDDAGAGPGKKSVHRRAVVHRPTRRRAVGGALVHLPRIAEAIERILAPRNALEEGHQRHEHGGQSPNAFLMSSDEVETFGATAASVFGCGACASSATMAGSNRRTA